MDYKTPYIPGLEVAPNLPPSDGQTFGRNKNPYDSGLLAETEFITQAVLRGFSVFPSIGHLTTVDVCIWQPGLRPIGVQVKLAHEQTKGGHVQCWMIPNSGSRSRQNGHVAPYPRGSFDILAGWVQPRNEWLFISPDLVEAKTGFFHNPSKPAFPVDNWDIFHQFPHTGLTLK